VSRAQQNKKSCALSLVDGRGTSQPLASSPASLGTTPELDKRQRAAVRVPNLLWEVLVSTRSRQFL
jgi:hypothetical protein